MKTIQLKDAKTTLSAVVDEAVAGRPSLITRHGKGEAVVISVAEYKRLTKKIPSFGELLMSFPGDAGDLPLRSRKGLRDVF